MPDNVIQIKFRGRRENLCGPFSPDLTDAEIHNALREGLNVALQRMLKLELKPLEYTDEQKERFKNRAAQEVADA